MSIVHASELVGQNLGTLRGEIDATTALEDMMAFLPTGDTIDFSGTVVRHDSVVDIPKSMKFKDGLFMASTQTLSSWKANGVSGLEFDDCSWLKNPRTATTLGWLTGDDVCGLKVMGGSGLKVTNCTFDGQAGAGLAIENDAQGFEVTNCQGQYTANAALFMGYGAHDGVVDGWRSVGPGDDGWCVDGGGSNRCYNITVRNSYHNGMKPSSTSDTTATHRPGTRGFSILSASNILVEDFTIKDAALAAFSITAESGFLSDSSDNITIRRGTITGGAWGNDPALAPVTTAHPGILIYSDRNGKSITDVLIEDVTVTGLDSHATWDMHFFASGGGSLARIKTENVKFVNSQGFSNILGKTITYGIEVA